MLNAVRSDASAKVWLDSKLGLNIALPFCGYSITENGKQVGAFAFNNYTGKDVELTIACDERLNMRVVRFIAYLAFFDLNTDRLTCRTRASNRKAINGALAAGFKLEGRLREYFNGEDALIFGMLAKEQRLVKRK